jgi:site-specific DNA-methyltransferase (adenine-specific)
MEQDQVITQDCLPILANMPDQSIDVLITDPPYLNGKGLFADSLTDGIAGLYLAAKKTKKHIVFFWSPVVNPPSPPPGWYHVATHIWDKPDCKTSITYEHIIVWSREYKLHPFKVWTVPILDFRSLRDWKQHPTQKPLRLLRYLVETYSDTGDLIVDPFGGTGTTAVAAKQLKRHYLLIENNEEYAQFAQQRLTPPPTDNRARETKEPNSNAVAKTEPAETTPTTRGPANKQPQ